MAKGEIALESACRTLAKSSGHLFYKWVAPGTIGVPDRLLFKTGGELIIVELKNPNGSGKLSTQQKRRIKELTDLGFRVEVVKSLEEFKALL